MQLKKIVTTILIDESTQQDRILLLRKNISTHQKPELWSGVSSDLQEGMSAEEEARSEILNHSNITHDDLHLLARGEVITHMDSSLNTQIAIHPFLFGVAEPDRVQLDQHFVESQWVLPEKIIDFDTTPHFRNVFDAVYPIEILLLEKGEELERRVQQLSQDQTRGASELAQDAAQLLRDVALTTNDVAVLEKACLLIAKCRPAVAPICNIALTILGAAHGALSRDPLAAAARSARRMTTGLESASQLIAQFGRVYLKGIGITFSASSSVRRALVENRDQITRVIIVTSPSSIEGFNQAARLKEAGFEVEIIEEFEIVDVLHGVDFGVIGASSYLGDGSIVNKKGALALANAVVNHGHPFYVLADTLKLAPWTPDAPIKVGWEEERQHNSTRVAESHNKTNHHNFEIVPSNLITKYVTDEGIRNPEQMAMLARSSTKLWAQLNNTNR
jgi:translation initiation factor 2B subunit (eIF-2B alpha/beta/delta family)